MLNEVSKTLEQFIKQYIEEIGDEFSNTKASALKNICNYDIAQKDVYTLSRQDFSSFAIERRKGNPLEMLDGVSPIYNPKRLITHLECSKSCRTCLGREY